MAQAVQAAVVGSVGTLVEVVSYPKALGAVSGGARHARACAKTSACAREAAVGGAVQSGSTGSGERGRGACMCTSHVIRCALLQLSTAL